MAITIKSKIVPILLIFAGVVIVFALLLVYVGDRGSGNGQPGATTPGGAIAQPAGDGDAGSRLGETYTNFVDSRGRLHLVGYGTPHAGAGNMAEKKATAMKAAETNAFAALATAVDEFPVFTEVATGNTLNLERARTEIGITRKVEGNVESVTTREESDGSIMGVAMVVSQLPLNAGAVARDAMPLIKQQAEREDLPKFNPPAGEPASIPIGATGIIIDTRGFAVKPALAPKVLVAGTNSLIYGYDTGLSEQYIIQRGMVGYVRTPEQARGLTDRIGDNPLEITAVDGNGANCTIRLEDAQKIAAADVAGKLLRDCRVVFIVD